MAHWAVIFDWDGVIVDSSAQHKESWEVMASRESLVLPPDHFDRSFGMKNQTIIREMFRWSKEDREINRLGDLKETLFREILRRDGLQPLPGVEPLLQGLQRQQISFAVGSSTPLANLECAISMLGFEDYFTVLVSSNDVRRGKPDPDVFLQAAAKLGLDPARCLVIEDAQVGVDAARAAGMKVLAVASTHPRSALNGADRVVDSLEEVEPAELATWFSG